MGFLSRSTVAIVVLSVLVILAVVREHLHVCPSVAAVSCGVELKTAPPVAEPAPPVTEHAPEAVGSGDRGSDHVQSFLRRARALDGKSVIPIEPFVDDTPTARPVLCQASDRLFVGSQWAAIALSEGAFFFSGLLFSPKLQRYQFGRPEHYRDIECGF